MHETWGKKFVFISSLPKCDKICAVSNYNRFLCICQIIAWRTHSAGSSTEERRCASVFVLLKFDQPGCVYLPDHCCNIDRIVFRPPTVPFELERFRNAGF